MSNNFEIAKMSESLKKIPKLSKKEEAYLIRNLKSKNKLRREVAIQKLWRAKLYLIINVVWKVRNIGIVPELSEGDLLSEASIGLLSGLKGSKLGSQDININAYLRKAILNHLRTFIKSKSRMIDIKGTWCKIKVVVEALEELSQRNTASPSKEEVAEFLGLRLSEIEKAYFWLKEKKISLDSQIKDESNLSWHDVISVKNGGNQEEACNLNFINENLKKVVASLSPKVAPHILAYYGIDGGGGKTFEEIALELGQTKQNIKRAVKEGLLKLRKNSNLQKIYEDNIKW